MKNTLPIESAKKDLEKSQFIDSLCTRYEIGEWRRQALEEAYEAGREARGETGDRNNG
jgi:hypothetical protein